MRADEETPKPINGHDRGNAPAVPAEKPHTGALTRQVVGRGTQRVIYLMDGQYVGEIHYVSLKADALPAIAADFLAYVRERQAQLSTGAPS